MKQFRKTENGFFICEECGEICSNKKYLSRHVGLFHNKKIYYDKWLRDNNEGICKICGVETEFIGFARNNGYKPYCCKACIDKGRYIQTCLGNEKLYGVKNPYQRSDIKEKIKQTHLENLGVEYPGQSKNVKNKIKNTNNKLYGVDHNWKREDVRKKCKQTKKEKYGDENYTNREKSKITKKEKYGDENYTNREKSKLTCLEHFGVNNPLSSKEIQAKIKKTVKDKYEVDNIFQAKEIKEKCKKTCFKNHGVEYPGQSKKIKEKSKITKKEKYGDENYTNREKYKQTCLKNHGVCYPMQNKDIYEKQQRHAYNAKTYKDTKLFYRGTYEFDFLEKYLSLFSDIINAKSIKYIFEEKQHYYHPDFYIPSLNLIVEVKALYYYNKYKDQCEAKKKATISNGFNYIMIIDKDYKELNLVLKSS